MFGELKEEKIWKQMTKRTYYMFEEYKKKIYVELFMDQIDRTEIFQFFGFDSYFFLEF